MNILSGDLLFVWGHGIFDIAIDKVTHGASHVAMFLDENTLCEAQVFREIGEVKLDHYLKKADRLEVWTDETLTNEERDKMIEYAKSLYGNKYDYLLIPLELLHFEFDMNINWYKEHGHRICSTFCNDIAKHVNHIWTDQENPAPCDLMNYGKLKRKCILKSK
jgi:hypothetical protein